jgi:hypothetical protein
LAMRNVKVFGCPVDVQTAASKAEAVELLNTTLRTAQGAPRFGVAFIDVVMETDTAGLDLCEYIRETLGNKVTPLYVRTGQPGVAPERSVIDRYDISGYFTKAEMTEDKLYTLVKAGLRQSFDASRYDVIFQILDALIQASASVEHMSGIVDATIEAVSRNAAGGVVEELETRVATVMDGQVVGSGMDIGEEATLALVSELQALPATPIGTQHDSYVLSDDYLLITVAASDTTVAAHYLARTTGETPQYMVVPYYRYLHAAAGLWKKALVGSEVAGV